MYVKTFESDAKVWMLVLQSTLGSGNRIGGARLFALKQMIDRRLAWLDNGHWHGRGDDPELKHKSVMEACSRLCEFASESVITASEKQIYIHIMFDLLQTELDNLPKDQSNRAIERLLEHDVPDDGKDFDEAYPPEDSPEWVSPLPPLPDNFDDHLIG